MARKVSEIQKEILDAKANDARLNGLTSTSKSAIWRLFIYIIATVIGTLEKLFDVHAAEVYEKLAELKPHTTRWYHQKAMAFQYGFDLLPESDNFDNTDKTDEQIAASKVIQYAALSERQNPSKLVLKIATEKDGKLSELPQEIAEAFRSYMDEIKDAGVWLDVVNFKPDKLRLKLRIVRDKLVMKSNGEHIINHNFPVNDTLERFVRNLPFDGKLSLQKLVDALQETDGVIDLSVDEAKIARIDADGAASQYGSFTDIDIACTPASGYFVLNLGLPGEDKTEITYL